VAGASPGLTAGRGLKRGRLGPLDLGVIASPGLTAGRGLKPARLFTLQRGKCASPGLTAGRGLKQFAAIHGLDIRRHRPASRPGAD